jgi:hypothetical protein
MSKNMNNLQLVPTAHALSKEHALSDRTPQEHLHTYTGIAFMQDAFPNPFCCNIKSYQGAHRRVCQRDGLSYNSVEKLAHKLVGRATKTLCYLAPGLRTYYVELV